MKTENIAERFKLPSFVNGKPFSEAHKMLKERTLGKDDERKNDPQALSTYNTLVGRLKEAQEYVRLKSEPQASPEQNQMFLGGLLDKVSNFGGLAENAGGDNPLSGVSGDAVGGVAEGIAGMLGNKDGDVGAAVNGGAQALTGVLSGNPIDVAKGLFTGIKGGIDALNHTERNDRLERERNATHKNINRQNSDFAMGGQLKKLPWGGGLDWDWLKEDPKKRFGEIDTTTLKNASNLKSKTPITTAGVDTGKMPGLTNTPLLGVDTSKGTTDKSNLGENINKALRGASTAMTAHQLRNLEEAPNYNAPMLKDRYKRNRYDTAAGEARIDNMHGNISEAAANMAGGNAGNLMKMLTAAQLSKYSAKSADAGQRVALNNAENTKEQEFNSKINIHNLSQANMEDQVNAQNKGAFESQKGTLQAALAKSLEGHGTEGINKDRIKNLFDYDWLGKYLQNKGTATT